MELLNLKFSLEQMNNGDLIGWGSLIFLFLVSLINLFFTGTNKQTLEDKSSEVEAEIKSSSAVKSVEPKEEKPVEQPKKSPDVSWNSRVNSGLERTRSQIFGKIINLLKGKKVDEDLLDSIEEILYSADLPPLLANDILETIKKELKSETNEVDLHKVQLMIKDKLSNLITPIQKDVSGEDLLIRKLEQIRKNPSENKMPHIVMIVGVNGAGKTTTIGKLATNLTNQGAKVVVGACDTFRAAAVEQLEVWCKRANVKMIKSAEGADPSGVAYDTVKAAIEEKADICLVDTAGRLHTKSNLMDELGKTKRVMSKLIPEAPQDVFLVIDAITGQNALKQADEFNKALALTGLIFTKCDGSSKAGSAIGIVDKLKVPIAYIGVGESAQDLNLFDTDLYLDALIGLNASN